MAARESPLSAMFSAIRRAPSRSPCSPLSALGAPAGGGVVGIEVGVEVEVSGNGSGGEAGIAAGVGGAAGTAGGAGASNASSGSGSGFGLGRRRGRDRGGGRLRGPGALPRAPGGGVVELAHVRLDRGQVRSQPCGAVAQRGHEVGGLRVHRLDALAQHGGRAGDRGDLRLGPRDRVGARVLGVGRRLLARGARVVGGALLDPGGGRLGGFEDPLHLRAGARSQRLPGAAFERVAQLLDLGRERAQVRVDGGGVVAPAGDRKVALLDALAVQLHGLDPTCRGGCSLRYFFLRTRFLACFSLVFLAGFVLGQPLTVIGVLWWISAPFWATNAVGIARDSATCLVVLVVTFLVLPWTFSFTVFFVVTVFVGAHRFPFAASAEYLPSWQCDFEAGDGLVGDGVERAARNPCFADER